MAEVLFAPKEELCSYFLKRDLLYHYIPEDERGEMMEFAWNRGRQTAKRFQGEPIGKLIENCGIRVCEREKGANQIFSEYYQNKNLIILNMNCIQKNFIEQNQGILKTYEYEEIRDLFLAHEYFHYLECHDSKVGVTFQQRKVTARQIWRWKYQVGIRMLSEIAAHSFTRHFMDFSSLLKFAFDPEAGISE